MVRRNEDSGVSQATKGHNRPGKNGKPERQDPGEIVQKLHRRLKESDPAGLVTVGWVLAQLEGSGPAKMGAALDDTMLNVAQVAARLDLTPKAVYRLAKSQSWPFAHKMAPKVLRFSAVGLERWIAEHRPGTMADNGAR